MPTIQNLQTLRAIGAILIFAHHFGFKNYIFDSFGDCAVCWFMMLSGFVSYGAWCNIPYHSNSTLFTETVVLLKKRVIKMAPLYYIGLLIALILAKFTCSALSVFTTALMVQSWIPQRDVFFGPNSPAWFVSSLLYSIALFPAIARFSEKTRAKLLIIILIIYFCALTIIPENKQLYWIYIFPPMQFPSFSLE